MTGIFLQMGGSFVVLLVSGDSETAFSVSAVLSLNNGLASVWSVSSTIDFACFSAVSYFFFGGSSKYSTKQTRNTDHNNTINQPGAFSLCQYNVFTRSTPS